MTATSPTLAAVRDCLRLIEDGAPPSDAELSRALDALAMAYHDCPPGALSEDDPERPDRDYQALYQSLGARFPDYGFYSVVDPFTVPAEESGLMDAVDDLADIVLELREILWRRDRFGDDDAHCHFRLNFEIHIGGHVRSLSGYLHARQFGWP